MILATILAAAALAQVAPNDQPMTAQLTGRQVMERLEARPEPDRLSRRFTFELTDRRGSVRREEITGYRARFEKEHRTVLFYTDPGRVRGTAFLTFDYADPASPDDQWLYLPALRKVRRISASDRGDAFLGTDFTYEEIKKDQKVELADYVFTLTGVEETVDGELYTVEGVPVSPGVAAELGVSRVTWSVDPEIWMSRRTEHYDRNGNHARTITLEAVETIDGFATATDILAVDHKTGHSSRLVVHEADNDSDVDDNMFSQAQLRRGR